MSEVDQSADRQAAYQEAAVELGKGIALGLVPFLGQAIDAYDTVESSITLYQAKAAEDKENAQFDFLLALVGWIPGPGDGVKKSLRIVNRDPDRFAPVLYDLLRFVLQECGIKTSPEALLEEIFNASKLKTQIDTIRQGIEDSSAYQSLPESMRTVVGNSMIMASTQMPVLVGVVEKRLKKWRGKQRNSSANEQPVGPAKKQPPEAKNSDTAKSGKDAPAPGHANASVNAELGAQSLAGLTNEMVGISGEHIADYICAYDFGWGKNWSTHDKGAEGSWKGGKPNKSRQGKLSQGGNPKAKHVLYKLSDGANGTGIDAVWRAEGNNKGKPYAIVEAKATVDEDAPKFCRKLGNTRKPAITSKFGVNVIGDASELLEPLEEEATEESAEKGKKGGGKTGGKAGGKAGKAGKQPTGTTLRGTQKEKTGDAKSSKDKKSTKDVVVQMSPEWIELNLDKAVERLAGDIRRRGYSRHLFFAPAYHSDATMSHLIAKRDSLPDDKHAEHKAFHYDDDEVKMAVNKRKASLQKKYGELPSLKAEK
ncbi:MAG: hypothetical protein H6R15_4246 [Proteobacteria bacterium]|nr:hypothetical protein [Pseudomonadota bacterium]